MKEINWYKELPHAITICDANGDIIYMNDKSIEVFKDDGGENLIGKNLFECHSTASNQKIKEMICTQQNNIYTIEKNGRKKMIIQTPFYSEKVFAGIVEISIELPESIPHFKRD